MLRVDDNPSNLAKACEWLSRGGITPILATAGTETVAVARKRERDLILMDLQMPVLNGDVLRQWGLDGILEKPCSAVALQTCPRRWCGPQGLT